MELPRPISNLLDHAKDIDSKTPERIFAMEAMVITPDKQIPLLIPSGFSVLSAFARNHSDDARLLAQIQPGVYFNEILPHKDNLFIEITKVEGYVQTVSRFRATPLGDGDPQMQGNNTALANLSARDDVNMISVTFQLQETGYAILKNKQVADTHLMSKLNEVLFTHLTEYGKELTLTGPDAFKGVDIEYPFDNDRYFQHILIPAAVPLVNLGQWIQGHPEFGFYSTGLGMYYRKGMWYIYPLFKRGRYTTGRQVVDVYRLPENIVPTLKRSHFKVDSTLTILSTGQAQVTQGQDIRKQNKGTGKRIISADALMGETGKYYHKGKAVTTRSDSLSEYQTARRASGEEMVPYHVSPSSNLCQPLSENAYQDGKEITIPWHNSDCSLIVPGMPCRYYYLNGQNVLMYKEGTVLTIKSDYQIDNSSPGAIVFREHSALTMFINDKEFEAPQ